MLIRTGVARREHGRFLFVFAFHICIPALVFDALADARLTRELAVLPLAALLAIMGGFVAGTLVSRPLALPRPQLGVFLLACTMVNTPFTLPFIEARLGDAGVVRLMAFDVVSAVLAVTLAYAIAVRSNPQHSGKGMPWRRLLVSPPLYGVLAGLVANVTHLQPAAPVQGLVDVFSAPTGFIVTVGIGMLLVIDRSEVRISMWAIGTRLMSSLLIGLALIALFDLTGVERAVLLTLCVAPVGFNTVTFASLENLDLRLATCTVSLSLAASLVLVPVVLLAVA